MVPNNIDPLLPQWLNEFSTSTSTSTSDDQRVLKRVGEGKLGRRTASPESLKDGFLKVVQDYHGMELGAHVVCGIPSTHMLAELGCNVRWLRE
jgi:hypothetical protein